MQWIARKRFWIVVSCFAMLVGCETDVRQALEQPAERGFLQADNEFSDAPISPDDPVAPGDVVDEQIEAEGKATQSFFTAYQIDPEAEDTAGPKFITADDVDQDGMLDLVTGWNESQPIQLHLQRRGEDGTISFKTINLGGTTPLAITAGVEVGQINDDGWLDIVVLVKSTGCVTFCPPIPPATEPTEIGVMDGLIVILFSPGDPELIEDGDAWRTIELSESNRFPGLDEVSFYEAATRPELAGFTGLAVGEIDGQPGEDIVVAFNAAECETLGQKPPINTVDLYANPGGVQAENEALWSALTLARNAPNVKDVELADIDDDGDLDVVSTWTDCVSANIIWTRNPLIPHQLGGFNGTTAVLAGVSVPPLFVATEWQERPLGHVATGADVIELGDVDSDGYDDLVVRSTRGQLVQWFRRPTGFAIEPVFPPYDPVPDRANFTWQVYTLAQFDQQEPEAVGIGDVTGDGQVEVMIAAEGAVFWYDSTVGDTLFNEWASNTVIRDNAPEQTDPTATAGDGAGVTQTDTSTHINALLVVDLDGDGKNDVVGTLDRRSGNGLSDDRLVWYRNTRTEAEDE